MPVTPPDDPLVVLAFKVPRSLRDELRSASYANGQSMADLIRLVLRNFLRGRYSDSERASLEGRP